VNELTFVPVTGLKTFAEIEQSRVEADELPVSPV